VRFLSPEWVKGFNDALDGVDLAGNDDGEAGRRHDFAVRQIVSGGPDGTVVTTLRVSGGRLSMTSGRTASGSAESRGGDEGRDGAEDRFGAEGRDGGEADVTVMIDWRDAVSMSDGNLSPAEAITTGRIRVRGDLGVLASGQATLAAAQPHLRKLRDETTY
jgi:hypothetical protein